MSHPVLANVSLGISAGSAAVAWTDSMDWWIRVIAGLMAIVAGAVSIYTNIRKK
jgi:cytochrome c biogenesis protein CcdA